MVLEKTLLLKCLRLFPLKRDYVHLNARTLLSKNIVGKFEKFNKGFTYGGN